MAHDTSWDVDSVRDEHESEEQWELRRAFIDRWKANYPRERLLCLARVFTNVEFMGCRYPQQVMQEIATLSQEVAQSYRNAKGNKLQRTFVSASDAAEDRAKGVKRKGGIVEESPNKRINFVAQGHKFDKPIETINLDESENNTNEIIILDDSENKTNDVIILDDSAADSTAKTIDINDLDDEKERKEKLSREYMEELQTLRCLDVRRFHDRMFFTEFGKLVFLVRPWMTKLSNIQSSCSTCGLAVTNTFESNCFTLYINGRVAASATGPNKVEARSIVETMAWNRMRSECVILFVKELFIASDSARISSGDVSGGNTTKAMEVGFGTPLESSVASKMMKLMGWSGGGLGAKEEGISEPIRPHLQQVHRAGLGSGSEMISVQQLKRSAGELMRKYRDADTLDIDLVFSNDFSKEERAELHQVARRSGLVSKSYGSDADRFLVVRKKLDPFTLVRAVIQKGGLTPKYQVFIPHGLGNVR